MEYLALFIILAWFGRWMDREQDKVHHEIHQSEREKKFLTIYNHL